MAVQTAPVGAPRFPWRRIRQVTAAVLTALAAGFAKSRPHAISVKQAITDHGLTVIGLGCIDTGVFTANTVAGWIVTGLTVLALEYKASE
jgi:hypothetical protein